MSAKLKNKGVVPSITVPDGGKWASEARQTAAALLAETGLPHRRDEYWKYTDPTTLTAPEATPAAIFESDEPLPFDGVDAVKIVFVDGVFDAAQSDALELDGVEIETLSDAAQKDIHWAGSVYGVLEGRGQYPVSRPLASYNTAMAEQGFVIRATGKAAKPISFIYLHESETSDAVIHHTIKLDEGADLTVLENGPAAARINAVMEVEVADTAAFHHVRAQGRDHERRTATHIFARLGTESSFKSFTLTVNGILTRNDAIIEFTGDNANATVAGACAGDGAFHHDDTVFITHDAVNCESRQVFKKVLRNGAVGVFQGKILVKADAQKTDGYQISQGLLLDENSTFQAKPELEIYADDVACSHGSTVGAIDDTALFYLTSRGIPHKEAQDMLTLAFLGEAIDEVEDEALADDLRALLEGWMARRHG
ncbi:SufB/SufD family protein [Neptunicoccus cionae]|uniref:Fe-S cluster assembly protein SufD n=1 Tax=Neptunicoccus cionae TaxID=2035344 RepID=A0A916QU36_9RHOB|nr:SufD family Fe-S cluster assembly protein [Amylibacter cionae]GGA11839.1 Fe-S cluster assembly protein SufD [Amylibacter cionae]